MEMSNSNSSKSSTTKICVTGGSGYIGSWLIKSLLEKGHIVHTTLRNIGDSNKVGLLKSLPGADSRLVIFEADLNNPDEFNHAINGCEFVFHVATPLLQTAQAQFTGIVEAAVGAVRGIAEACIKSGTVKRLIYTATVVSASPLKEDGTGFKDVMDESCWTPLNLPYPYSNDYLKAYADSKTLAEREVLSFCKEDIDGSGGLEVVTLACALVGGNTILPYMPDSMVVLLSQLSDNAAGHQALKFLEGLLGKVPIIHIEDVINAHIFCMEKPSMTGRYLCSSAYVTTIEVANYFRENHPEVTIQQECVEEAGKGVKWGSRKLEDMGFEYKHDMKMILDDSLECQLRLQVTPSNGQFI